MDIDGVLNSRMFELNRGYDKPYIPYYSDIDPECTKILNELIKRTNAKIVIHSSWRDSFSLDEFKAFFFHFGISQESIIGVTSNEMDKVPSIKKYLNENNIKDFIVLEDENIFELKDELNKKMYKASPKGLNSEDLERVVNILGKGC